MGFVRASEASTQANHVVALVSGLAPEEREGRPLMVLQTGYFDDSGSDTGSRWYVLAGFIAPVSDWKTFSAKWFDALNKEPNLRYFRMAEAMAMDGQFRNGWNEPLRNQRVVELVDIVAELNPVRVECFLNRSDFNSLVKGLTIGGDQSWGDPYFLLFYHLILSVAGNASDIGWNSDCDFIFDDQGKLGKHAVERWDWMKENVESSDVSNTELNRVLGSPPKFRDDVKFLPLQAADMLAWLIRDIFTKGHGDNIDEIARTALKHIEGRERKILRIEIDRDKLMRLGASFLVARARVGGYL